MGTKIRAGNEELTTSIHNCASHNRLNTAIPKDLGVTVAMSAARCNVDKSLKVVPWRIPVLQIGSWRATPGGKPGSDPARPPRS